MSAWHMAFWIVLLCYASFAEGVPMKANKVHKRLAKIEAIISDLTERYSKGAVHIREALQDAKAAIAHVKAAVTSQASSWTAKNPPPVTRQKTIVKKATAKPAIARTAKKRAPIKKAVKKTAAKKTAPVPVRGKSYAKRVPATVQKPAAPVHKAPPPVQTAPAPVEAATQPDAPVPMDKYQV